MRSVARTIWRTSRFEIITLAIAIVTFSALALYFTVTLRSLQVAPACLAADATVPASCHASDAEAAFLAWASAHEQSDLVGIGMAVLPLIVGGVLGAPLVGREIERGTTHLAWWVSSSRRRWLIERALVASLIAIALLVPLAILSQVLEAAREPAVDPNASLSALGQRGPSLVFRGLALFACGVLFGAVTGRVLPALLVAAALAVPLLLVGRPALSLGMGDEVVGTNGTIDVRYAIVHDRRWEAPDGSLLDDEQALLQAPSSGSDPYVWLAEHYRSVSIGIPRWRYPDLEARGAVVFLGVTIIALTSSLVVVDRRRPA